MPQASPEVKSSEAAPKEYSQGQKKSSREQNIFGMEPEMERPVTIPQDVLAILGNAPDVQERCSIKTRSAKPIPPSWFVASELHLHSNSVADLIVQPGEDDPCIGGMNITSYWVFQTLPLGHKLVLTNRSFGLKVMTTRTKGYRDIDMGSVTPGLGEVGTIYKFDGKKYRAVRNYRRPIRDN